MAIRHWTLLLSALMFVASIWFVLAGAGSAAAPARGIEPVATVRHLMDGLVAPASTTVYRSVSIIVDENGITENYPQSEDEWRAVEGSAAVLAEAGGLLIEEGRRRDDDQWVEIAQQLVDASKISLKAAADRDKDALLASGEALNASCDNCHQTYNVGD